MALTGDWCPLGDVFYRKQELYQMRWADQVDLSKFIIAAAPYGGPIAIVRDEGQAPRTTRPAIYLFSSAGRELATIRWNSGPLLAMGWSCTEELLCIQEDGAVLVYDIFGSFKRTFTMGQEAKDNKVIEVKVFSSYQGTGIAVLTGSYRVYVLNNVEEPRVRRLAEVPGLTAPPSSWVILNQDRQSRALVARDADLFLLDHGGQYQEQKPPLMGAVFSFIEMAVSFNNKYLALFADTGLLWIGSSDLQKVYCEFDTKCSARPRQLAWCGVGAICGYWDNILLTVGPQKDWVKHTYDSPVHLVPEVDGLRIIGSFTHEFFQRVPSVVEDIYKIGSLAPGAMLYEASKQFQKGSQRADEYIRMIKDRLEEAVEQCIEAAGHEMEPATQKSLLRAASFGKCFLTDYRPEAFVNMCQMLRVLNAVREFTLGIPITYTQLHTLTVRVLLDRLVLRRQYLLAIRICQYLNMPDSEGASRILAHWACYKVQQTDVDDEQLARAIALKLGDTAGVSYSEIAHRAAEWGRAELAIRLLDFEPRAAEQVPLLMKMKRDHLALAKAIESGDTDLVFTVLLHLKETMPFGEFLMAIRSMPTAHALFLQYCREQNRRMLRDLYYQEDLYQDEANCRVMESYEEERIEARLSQLLSAQESYTKARNEWAARETEDQMKLLKRQRKLEEELNRPYLNLSLHKTIYQLTLENQHKHARQLRKDFKVPDRRFWWLTIEALSEAGDWIELERFSKSQKSPIGYEPFVDVCMKRGNRFEAQKYLPKVTPKNKVKCYIKAGQVEEAAEIAFQQKSDEDLVLVLNKCSTSNRSLAEKVQTMRAQLTSRR